jgi:lipid A ethanolaminephosphotransferase
MAQQSLLSRVIRFFERPRTSSEFIFAVALFLAVTANTSYFSAAAQAFGTEISNWPFLISLFFSLTGVLVLALSALCHRILLKPLLMFMLIISAALTYFSHTYGTIVDTHMIANALETDRAEAQGLWNPMMLLWIGVFGVVPSLAIWRTPLIRPS